MKAFFQVTDMAAVLGLRDLFQPVETRQEALDETLGRVLAADVNAHQDLPGFARATMDGYAVQAASTFGASEGSPAYLTVVGAVPMGQSPDHIVGAGQASRIATGGMLPQGADSVMMVEHVGTIDDQTIEVYRSVAPGQHVVAKDEDAAAGQLLLAAGQRLRSQEIGLLAACGMTAVPVFKRPRVGIISSGDEVLPVDQVPSPGQVRDVNSHTLAGLVREAGGHPVRFGIVKDRFEALRGACVEALAQTDMVLISGGSSVGTRDLTLAVMEALPESRILVHGVAISPGKPTILAQCGGKPLWGLPGHVTSAMVVFRLLVHPFLEHLGGCAAAAPLTIPARLTRNVASAQGRVDFVRVRLERRGTDVWADPVLGASGLIRTMVVADGLVAVDQNSEGLEKGEIVPVLLFSR